jgi:serine/threonine-protein kinase
MRALPDALGRYQVLGELAMGGMAEILLARVVGPRGFERPVVIKRILPHLARQESFVSMFLDEARIAAGIRHKNVIHVEELVEGPEGLYLVMEYLEGESAAGLTRRLFAREQSLDVALGVHIVAEACAGLHAAHEMEDVSGQKQDLVHRDVTPHNLFVTYDGTVKVLDFGIAKAADRITQTEAGQLKGKFGYMSPEQCRGHTLDRRTDNFALGVVPYELTTARRLFQGDNAAQTIQAVCDHLVVPPSRLAPGYPAELEAVCMRALSAAPEERYATAMDMRRDLLSIGRDLAPGQEPTEALGRLMQQVFEDRVAEKRELLRRLRAGSKVTHVPAGEVDQGVELAAIPVELVKARPRNRVGALAALLAAAVLAMTVAAFISRAAARSHAEAPRASATTPPATSPAAEASVSASPAAPAQPEEVVVRIETRPAGATVSIEGNDMGTTPFDLRLRREPREVLVALRRAGYVSTGQSVVPDHDQSFVIDLAPNAKAGRPPPSPPHVARASTAAPAPSTTWAKWN